MYADAMDFDIFAAWKRKNEQTEFCRYNWGKVWRNEKKKVGCSFLVVEMNFKDFLVFNFFENEIGKKNKEFFLEILKFWGKNG